MADEKLDKERREQLDTLKIQLRQAESPTSFLELALASPLCDVVKVGKTNAAGQPGPYFAQFSAPEPEPENKLLEIHGPGYYNFAAYAARGGGMPIGVIIGRRSWPIPSDWVMPEEEIAELRRTAGGKQNVVDRSDLGEKMRTMVSDVGNAEIFRRVVMDGSKGNEASSLAMVKEIAQIMKPAGDGGGVLFIKMLEFIAEQNRAQLAMMQKQIEAIASDDKEEKSGGLGTVKETVEFVRDVAGALGWDVGGWGGKHESGIWDALPTIAEKVAEPLVALGNRALDLRAAELHARTGAVVTEVTPRQPALAPEGGATMPKVVKLEEDPRWKDIREMLVAELSKPADDLDVEGLATWLRTIPTGADETLYDKCADLAETREHFARLSIRLVDPRLADDTRWPAVKLLLAHIKDEEDEAERETKEPKA